MYLGRCLLFVPVAVALERASPSPIPSYISAQFDIPLAAAGLAYNDIAYLARAYNISRGQSGDAL